MTGPGKTCRVPPPRGAVIRDPEESPRALRITWSPDRRGAWEDPTVDGRDPARPYLDLIYQEYRKSGSIVHTYICICI